MRFLQMNFLSLLFVVGSNLSKLNCSGRSNVGKSSLINTLLQRKLARTSKTPGCTQLFNFYEVKTRLNVSFHLVDLPGAGFAKVGKQKKEEWNQLINEYLEDRENLDRVYLLVDSRHPELHATDSELIALLCYLRAPFDVRIALRSPNWMQVVLTKADLCSPKLMRETENSVQTQLQAFAHKRPRRQQGPSIVRVSSKIARGADDLRNQIIERARQHFEKNSA
mmetsp:Transcript_32445/g.70119  ORF Transcript_32445/g.70119 Transcript_32445/m.70119 type:complete len:223 (-) Transcript_32445:45-713(-)